MQITRVGRATAEQLLVYQSQHSVARLRWRAPGNSNPRNSSERGYPSGLVPSAVNRANCGNETESLTVPEALERSRSA